MSIIIKGMEMPMSCAECFVAWERCGRTVEWYYSHPQYYDLRHEDCPIIHVPRHGRLIDADALMLKIQDYIEEYSPTDEHGMHNLKWCAMKEAEMAINDAPTIIESEE